MTSSQNASPNPISTASTNPISSIRKAFRRINPSTNPEEALTLVGISSRGTSIAEETKIANLTEVATITITSRNLAPLRTLGQPIRSQLWLQLRPSRAWLQGAPSSKLAISTMRSLMTYLK